jgi:pimeloyl-ACP methyl ester carboxylesterase
MFNDAHSTPWRTPTNNSNRPLVFIHGVGDNSRIWKLQVEHFGPDYTFPIDLPGHGKRADNLPPEVSVSDYTRAAHEIIFQELRLKAPTIAGHSLGGAIALTMALEDASELSGLILIGTGAKLRVDPSILEETQRASGVTYRDWAACNIFDIMDKLYEIHLPTLIICGADDRLTPVKYSQYMHDCIQGSTLCIIPNAGHEVMKDQPEQVNQAIDEWLRHN